MGQLDPQWIAGGVMSLGAWTVIGLLARGWLRGVDQRRAARIARGRQ